MGAVNTKRQPMSKVRKVYFARLVGRIIVFVLSVILFIFRPNEADILDGMNFFKRFSVLHILWLIWIIDMIHQLMPVKKHISLGSQKQFRQKFKPIVEKINYAALREYVISTTKSAYKVFVLWAMLLTALGVMFYSGILSKIHLFIVSVAFYVCDLICVLIWCPFRLIMRNKCCTTCRIFNWDHLMMFTPMMFIDSFYTRTLLIFSFAIWVIWELCVMMYPERFWEHSNESLKCSQCTDKLCTQYCRKLR